MATPQLGRDGGRIAKATLMIATAGVPDFWEYRQAVDDLLTELGMPWTQPRLRQRCVLHEWVNDHFMDRTPIATAAADILERFYRPFVPPPEVTRDAAWCRALRLPLPAEGG